jgi:hypothetical protein
MNEQARVVDVAAPVRVPKTAELVASQLRRQIVRGELKEAARPPEARCKQFGVSRPTLAGVPGIIGSAHRVRRRAVALSTPRR